MSDGAGGGPFPGERAICALRGTIQGGAVGGQRGGTGGAGARLWACRVRGGGDGVLQGKHADVPDELCRNVHLNTFAASCSNVMCFIIPFCLF